MTEIFSADSLEDEIFNERPLDHLILSGYPYSGKKHIVYEVLKKKKDGPTLLIPRNRQWSDKQENALNELAQSGINVHQYGYDSIESVCKSIGEGTVLLFLPSKFISENGEKEKLKALMDEIKKNHRLIAVTREYNYLYIQNRIEKIDLNKKNVVLNQIKTYVSNFLKKKVAGKILEKNREVIKLVCNEGSAQRIVNDLRDKNGNELSKDLKDMVLRHGKINHGTYKGYYFPGLIAGGDKGLEDIEKEKIDDVEEFEKAMAVDASITTALGISSEETISSSIKESISATAGGFKAIAGSILPLLIPAVGGFAASLLIFLFLGSDKKKEFGNEIVRWASVWRKMPIERKEYIAYHYDILFNLSPGESMDILEGLFGRQDYRDIKDK
ncbi:MAG: hypothetical protein QW597_07520, partial [Thermoplasmataceae archaeon]